VTSACTARAISSSNVAKPSDAVSSRSLVLRGQSGRAGDSVPQPLESGHSKVRSFFQTCGIDSSPTVCSLVCSGPSETASD
jgi:hypothetical protein